MDPPPRPQTLSWDTTQLTKEKMEAGHLGVGGSTGFQGRSPPRPPLFQYTATPVAASGGSARSVQRPAPRGPGTAGHKALGALGTATVRGTTRRPPGSAEGRAARGRGAPCVALGHVDPACEARQCRRSGTELWCRETDQERPTEQCYGGKTVVQPPYALRPSVARQHRGIPPGMPWRGRRAQRAFQER